MATPEEVAAFALMLASNDHPYMTGAQMVIDGGKNYPCGLKSMFADWIKIRLRRLRSRKMKRDVVVFKSYVKGNFK
jgi:hypothetical protein